jgi:multimeric flavodoxin WrbA
MNQDRTLVLFGSPRPKGNTSYLLNSFMERMPGAFEVISAYDAKIHACTDCRYCWNKTGCSIQDDMNLVYQTLRVCNQVIIATPIYFAQPTGPMMSVFSRLQTYFAGQKFRHETMSLPYKKAGVLLTGGGSGGAKQSLKTIDMVLTHMNATRVGEVLSLKTDLVPTSEDTEAKKQLDELCHRFLRV